MGTHVDSLRSPRTHQERKAIEAAKFSDDEVLITMRTRPYCNNKHTKAVGTYLPSGKSDISRGDMNRNRRQEKVLTDRRKSRKFVEQLKLGDRLLVIEPVSFEPRDLGIDEDDFILPSPFGSSYPYWD